jgi:adenylosuccinate lyase
MVRRGKRQLSYDAVSPVDGRYREEVKDLSNYFSERALFERRAFFELEYLKLLAEIGVAPRKKIPRVNLSIKRIKEIEKKTGHDVKALEIYLRERLKAQGAGELSPYVHLGLTSEDVNSVALALIIRDAKNELLVPEYSSLAILLARIAEKEAETLMLGRTHGLPAIPTTFGKELAFFAERIAERVKFLYSSKPEAKISGAVGTYASFKLIQNLDWPKIMKQFGKKLGIEIASLSKQTAPWEKNSDIIHCIINVNKIMESLSLDLWLYSMLGLLSFGEIEKVGSSTMPHKINPADIENAEGQAKVSNSILMLLAYEPQLTRLQRDLSDSAIKRMLGQGIAHSVIACRRLKRSLATMKVNREAMKKEVMSHPEILSEAAQISMRLKGDERGYEKVRYSLIQGKFDSSNLKISPEDYVGFASDMAREVSNHIIRQLSSLKDP